MAFTRVNFRYYTGIKRNVFRNPRIRGSWDSNGTYSDEWTERTMQEITGEDGCPAFEVAIDLNALDPTTIFAWGVVLDGPQGANLWGIPTELPDAHSTQRYRQFTLRNEDVQQETYYFTYCRYLGANKYVAPGSTTADVRFAVWAPHAQQVEVVFGLLTSGYIYDDGRGIDPTLPVIALSKKQNGIWESAPIASFAAYENLPYLYRIVNAQGQPVYRTDIFSRHQIGCGHINPALAAWDGTPDSLDGTKSCSVVIDPDVVADSFGIDPDGFVNRIAATVFWAHEFTTEFKVPTHIEDLVIYELHIGALGFGKERAGNISDALQLLDHLSDLGVNAVELLPMSEFSGSIGWGYGDSHHFCIESSAGGRDQYKYFVKECHRRGIAVIQDVVYNHYDLDAERAQWQFDSTTPEENSYYWYEGRSSDYSQPDGGYLDNGSSGWSPRFWEEVVRQQFISSAVFLIEEMHVDGLRVDLTQAIHRDHQLHANGRSVGSANSFGQKMLREWSRTLRLIHPDVMLIAEDHSHWDGVTKPAAAGGLGFDATWYNEFYHNLIGDSQDHANGKAQLLKQAGMNGNHPLDMASFAGVLYNTRHNKIVFHESHDEAGNANGTARTMLVAVNHAPIWGTTRSVAEARSRLAFGLSLFSAGIPMFFMGEEIGAQKFYKVMNFMHNREDILNERTGAGAFIFRFYQDAITLSRRLRSIRSHNIDILHQSNSNRVLVFKRWSGSEEVMIFVSLNNTPFLNGYTIYGNLLAIPNAGWKEIFNSDSAVYGGQNVGNAGAILFSSGGQLDVKIPANGFVLFVKQ